MYTQFVMVEQHKHQGIYMENPEMKKITMIIKILNKRDYKEFLL